MYYGVYLCYNTVIEAEINKDSIGCRDIRYKQEESAQSRYVENCKTPGSSFNQSALDSKPARNGSSSNQPADFGNVQYMST